MLGVRDTADRSKSGRELAIVGLVASVLWAAVIGLVAVAATSGVFDEPDRNAAGELVESGSLSARDLRAGDCFEYPDGDSILSLDVGPCADSHDAQVISVYTIPGDDYPGEDEVDEDAERVCFPAFDRALDRASATGLSAPIDTPYHFTPTEDSWDVYDDRSIACVVRWQRAVRGGIAPP